MNTLYSNLCYYGRHALVLAASLAAAGLPADTLQLKNGITLKGSYTGGTATAVRFTTDAGEQTISMADIATITFDPPAATAAAATAAAPAAVASPATAAAPAAPAPAASVAKPAAVTVPAGTTLLVTMLDAVSSADSAGKTFRTKLVLDLEVGSVVVVPADTLVTGRIESASEAKRARGKSTLDIRLHEISASGRRIPIVTEGYEEAGEASVKKVAKSAAAGALVGAITGDAGTGAAIGAGVGVLRRGQSIAITPGTLLEFKLAQPFTFQNASP